MIAFVSPVTFTVCGLLGKLISHANNTLSTGYQYVTAPSAVHTSSLASAKAETTGTTDNATCFAGQA
jgi:hypothetical protein